MNASKEPSMEEILSSIKRIIAEESDSPQPRRPRPEPEEEPDVLELTQEFGEPEPEVAPWEEPDVISAEEAPAIAAAPIAPAPPPETLVSSASADATREALASLSRMVVKPENPAADNTLEGLVRELLRPMLKDWLDANLPGIVQATVDREVARIAGRTL
jgi:uncharacterized protein